MTMLLGSLWQAEEARMSRWDLPQRRRTASSLVVVDRSSVPQRCCFLSSELQLARARVTQAAGSTRREDDVNPDWEVGNGWSGSQICDSATAVIDRKAIMGISRELVRPVAPCFSKRGSGRGRFGMTGCDDSA